MKCNHIFIVAKISRAITDQSLKSSLFSVLSRHVPLEWEESGASSLKIAVVCTKSEVRTCLCHESMTRAQANNPRILTRKERDGSFAEMIKGFPNPS